VGAKHGEFDLRSAYRLAAELKILPRFRPSYGNVAITALGLESD